MKLLKIAGLMVISIITTSVLLVTATGSTAAFFNDAASGSIQNTAWTSALWSQTSQADYNAGVLNNVDVSSSLGNAVLPLTTASSSPSGNTGSWTSGANGYSSNNQYATFTPPVSVLQKSPTAYTGSAWATPANAYASDSSFATVTSSSPSSSTIWGSYGYGLSGNTITQVRVGYDALSAGSTITFQAAGANDTSNGGNATPGLPSGWAAGDIWLCLIVSYDNINSTLPAGWTAIDAGTNNSSTLRTTLYWRRAVAGDTAPVVTHVSGSYITSSIVGYRGCETTGSPFDVNQSVFTKTTASTTNNFGTGMTTTANNDMIVLLSGARVRTTSANYTGTPTPTERLDTPNTSSYGELIIADFTLATAGATGSRTSTITSSLNNGYQLSLKRAMPQIRIDVSWDGGTTWSAQQITTLTQTETSYWYDVTAATVWDSTKLGDANFKVRADALTVGFAGTVSLDWLHVEVSYKPTSAITNISPTTNTGTAWTNPANAYTSDSSFATITSGSPSGSNIWGNYGYTLSSDGITQVRVNYNAFASGSTITFQAAGANAKAPSGNVTPGLPSGWAVNDIWLCLITSYDNVTSTMPAGWSAIDAGTNNGTTLRTTLYWRRAVAGDIVPVVTHVSGSYITASIVGYRGCETTGSPFDINQSVYATTTASTTNNFGTGMTTTANNDMIVLLSGTRIRTTSTSYTGTPTPTERVDLPNANKYGELIIADFILPTAGATGSRASTITSSLNNGYQLSLKRAMPQIRIDVSWDGGTTWSAQQVTTLTQTETSYWYDVSAATAWDSTKLNDTNLKVRADALTVGFASTVSLDWLPVEVSYSWNHTYTGYGLNLGSNLVSKVEVGLEACATNSDQVAIDVSWDNGTSWSTKQTSAALGSSDTNTTTWFDFTSAAVWTPSGLEDANFKVRIWYLGSASFGVVSLDYLPVRVTYRLSSGTISSQVHDTGVTGTRWDALFWDETLAANTGITFEVRASDTLFLASDASLDWSAVGDVSPVNSGLSAGRYQQWRATLTTTVSGSTPVLIEVRLYYLGN